LIAALTLFGVARYADAAYQGAGPVVAAAFRRPRNQKAVNRSHARNRAPGERAGERAAATLKSWKVLAKLRRCPLRGTAIIDAIRVLQTVEEQHYRT